ncbi:hypothetical protein PUNSTDRAFT_137662 [Punctularia strigosozonata HHB-11173 SS5]|uniref:uncharacterized protein n=1 Tax=Punctularia strigosozonata (strain HHB-11173) TaxID=741275 RepID=UPI0004418673|nr:uncharacterized protein PUNSTDRAFT_137662 [Punctularia strigosozonata HHB-11173 SS5]EIN05554.1 hypothetical protein PUNSTDRAFT_137662 [Punctularia strigosozonata HHB-11173 SS5]
MVELESKIAGGADDTSKAKPAFTTEAGTQRVPAYISPHPELVLDCDIVVLAVIIAFLYLLYLRLSSAVVIFIYFSIADAVRSTSTSLAFDRTCFCCPQLLRPFAGQNLAALTPVLIGGQYNAPPSSAPARVYVDASISLNLAGALIATLNDKKSRPPPARPPLRLLRLLTLSGVIRTRAALCRHVRVYRPVQGVCGQDAAVRTTAVKAMHLFTEKTEPLGTAMILSALPHEINTAGFWQINMVSLAAVNQHVAGTPVHIGRLTPEIVPVLFEVI